jgi:hypothetical protein
LNLYQQAVVFRDNTQLSKAAFVTGKLAILSAPPTTILDFMTPYEVARKYDNLLKQYVHSAREALNKFTPAPLPQGDTVPNSPVPMEWAGNVLTDNEDKGQTSTAAPEDKGKGRDTQVAVRRPKGWTRSWATPRKKTTQTTQVPGGCDTKW